MADTYLSVGAPVLRALPELLAIGADHPRGHPRPRRRPTAPPSPPPLPPAAPLTWLPAEAGWSAILRLPAVRSDEAWALDLLAHDGVLVQPGYFFDLEGLGSTLVLSLLTPPEDWRAGLRAIAARRGRLRPAAK